MFFWEICRILPNFSSGSSSDGPSDISQEVVFGISSELSSGIPPVDRSCVLLVGYFNIAKKRASEMPVGQT